MLVPTGPAGPESMTVCGGRPRSNTATASLPKEAAYTFLLSGATVTELAVFSAVPSTQAPAVPVSETQPATPGFCVRAPVVGSRTKAATAELLCEATYTVVPSGAMATELAAASAVPLTQAPAVPSSEMHPAVLAFCVRTPVVVLRSKTETALLIAEVT